MKSLEGIGNGSQIGPYRVVERLSDDERTLLRAVTDQSKGPVCLLQLNDEEVEYLSPAKNLKHAHLARVLEVREHDGARFLVFESVPGTTLTERLAEIGHKTTVDAVGSALRVSDALSHLHDAGGVHGFLHTDSVLLDPPERLGPVLSFAPVPADERTFHSPERGETGKPSVADDAWAAAGLLHMMLTGNPPPKEGYGTVDELAEAGVEDPALRDALLHGLHRNNEQRSQDVRPLKRELARWFVEHAGQEASTGTHSSTQPPPLPDELTSSAGPEHVVASSAPIVVRTRRPRFLVLGAVGIVLGLGGAWGLSAWLSRPRVTLIERPIASAAAAPIPKSIDLSEVPVTGEEQPVELSKMASCVAGYLPKGAFVKSPELSWLCEEVDPQKGGQKLRAAVVSAAPKSGGPTDAMKIFSRLGWYEMAAHAVVRSGCCTDQKQLSMPEPGPNCESMAEALRDLGREVVASRPYEEPLKKFASAIDCELAAGRGATFGRTARSQPDEAAAFRELVDAIAR